MKTSTVDAAVARRFVDALFASAPSDSFVEVRFRRAGGMGQSFHRVDALEHVVAEVMRRAQATDVFVGVLPRRRRGGSCRDVLDAAWVMWVDCDTPEAVAALDAFRPAPSIVVASGAGGHRHAYWLLRAPVVVQAIEQANRRLAGALGGDPRCSEPARILRPAGSLWQKAVPPAPVRLLHLDDEVRHDLDEIVGSLADPPGEPVAHRSSRGERRRRGDPLLNLAPAGYVERLTGQRVGRSRKVRCPFHEDRTPSLHVFAEPERGWYCFGCGRGGSIYDLAALLWRRETRGGDFLRVRRELEAFVS